MLDAYTQHVLRPSHQSRGEIMFSVLRGRAAGVTGLFALAATLAVSSIGIVRADSKIAHPNKGKSCNSSSPCQSYTNNGSGAAFEAIANAQNARAMYVYATNPGADGVDINGGYIGIIGRAPAGSGLYPLVLTDSNGTNLNFTTTAGDFYYSGSLIQFATSRNGMRVNGFVPQSASRTIEDVGTGRIVNGQGTVVLDRTFASTIDLQSAYHVFITPNGDTRGLYVAAKTAGSFTVRETQGGRGSLSFDYRIVASPAGHAFDRIGGAAQAPVAPVHR
jgi:hypothetical protein